LDSELTTFIEFAALLILIVADKFLIASLVPEYTNRGAEDCEVTPTGTVADIRILDGSEATGVPAELTSVTQRVAFG
jgi:hypothetical protein